MSLLDFLGSDDAALGLGLLAAGGPTTDPNRSGFGARVAGAVQGVQANRAAQLQNKYLQSQIDENASQAGLRAQQLALMKRKMDWQAGLLGFPTDGAAPAAAGGAGPAAAAGAPAPGGAAPGGISPATPVGTPAGPMSLAQISQRYQIPYESLAMDMVNNDGKGIAEMVFKRGTPDMQVSNGYAYDKNKVGPGFMPQVNTSSTGQTSLILPNAQGTVDVSAPNGAVDTFRGYQGVQDRSRAGVTPGRPVLGADGRQYGQSQLQEVGGAPPPPVTLPGRPFGAPPPSAMSNLPPAQPGVTGNYSGDPSSIAAAIANINDPQERANAQAAFEQQQRAQGGAGPVSAAAPMIGPGAGVPSSAAGALDFSPQEKSTQAANAAAQLEQAKTGVQLANAPALRASKVADKQAEGDVVPTQVKTGAVDNATQALNTVDKALNAPGLNASVGLRGLLPTIPGTDAASFKPLLAQLKGTSFLTAYQGLRGGGAITEVEGAKAQDAVARLDTAQNAKDFKAALLEYRQVLANGLARAQQQGGAAGPTVRPTGNLTPPANSAEAGRTRTVARTGTAPDGRKVVQYSDGSVMYAP